MLFVFQSSPHLGFVFYSLNSPVIRSDWRKSEKMFHVIHRSRRHMIDNCHNTLGYHTVGYMSTYWNWRRVTEAESCNIFTASAEWRPLTAPNFGTVTCNTYIYICSYHHAGRKARGYCSNSRRFQEVMDWLTKNEVQTFLNQKEDCSDRCTNSERD
jgi:hypothetical protein